jgi:sterol 3beta-glucosyltransferase/vancomycin aglycone glucosyltransferase
LKIGIQTWGSEGDLRPFFALAEGLGAAGHDVRLLYSPAEGRDYSAQLAGARYAHQRVGTPRPVEELVRLGREIFSIRDPRRQIQRVVTDLLQPALGEMARSAGEVAGWADLLVFHPFAHPLGAAGERAGKPLICVYPTPLFPTRAMPPPGLPDLGPLNLLTWKVLLTVLSRTLRPSFLQVRSGFGLPPIKRVEEALDRTVLDLVTVSPTLLPRPPDWPAKIHLTGFLAPAPTGPARAVGPEVEAFLAGGPAPVYVTFGSMSAAEADPEAVLSLAERAARKAGRRVIVQTPGTALAEATGDTLRIGPASHDQLFPRCCAIVHHGGAGTTQAALRAGRPSVIVAHVADQFMWGRQLKRLGVAPGSLARHALDADRLARAIEAATTSESMRIRAEQLGRSMAAEDGVRRAVELCELARQAFMP